MSVDVMTFGCRLNSSESEVMGRLAAEAGLSDVIIINTCAVTAEATRQARQTIRKVHRERPDAKIVVTGCAAQAEPEMFAAMAEVDRVIGNDVKMQAKGWHSTRRFLGGDLIGDGEKVVINDIFQVKEQALHLVDGLKGRSRAFVQVQNGCDHRCTFCIIPYGRGDSRSVPMGEVVSQIRALCENGYREVVLTGVDITSYGIGLPGEPKLGALVKAVLKHVPDLPRLRISSIDSIEADKDLMDVIADEPRFMPHLHLSLQAGDNIILKRMKRRHLREDAIAFCADARRLRPDMVFGADIIAGFPTETDEMFRRSLDIVDECGLTFLHVFPYSARKGTPAAKMPPVKGDIIKMRAKVLREKGEAILRGHLDSLIGKTLPVLTERGNMARTEDFVSVRVKAEVAPGEIIDLHITAHDGCEAVGVRPC